MPEKSLGVIVPGGTGPKAATVNIGATQADMPNGLPIMAASYRVQHWPGNTGKIWVGDSTLEPGTGTGVFGYVPEPAAADTKPYESQAPWSPVTNLIDMSTVLVDTENATDGALITYLEG